MLLILAGVALATLIGQGNIIGNAENAVGKYNNSVADEQQLLNEIEKYFQNYLEGGNPPTPSEPVDENGLATENTTITTDEENVQIVIPKGFAPVILNGSNSTYSLPGQDGSVKEIMPYEEWSSITAEQINQGIVIVDHAITYDGGNPIGTTPDFNEYVWIPIQEDEDFATIEWEGNAMSNTTIWNDNSKEYNDMVDSVHNNKGFYVGRYEACNNGNDIAQTKRNQVVWTYANYDKSISACKDTSAINSHLMYGIEWDSILNWINGNATIASSEENKTKIVDINDIENDSSSWGNYSISTGNASTDCGEEQVTGYSEYWKVNNIYDLAGNLWEWTQEECSIGAKYKIVRGGFYYMNGNQCPVAFCDAVEGASTDPYIGFRISLYI